MVREIWNKFNVSTILILPLFYNIISNIRSNKNEKLNILGFFIENGLINTYLFNYYYRNENYHTLSLLFNSEKINSTLIIKQKYPSLLDIIINSEEFLGLTNLGDNVLLTLKIDPKWDYDINKIIEGLYSEVSDGYKKEIVFKGSVKDSKDEMANYIFVNNLPARIVYKSKKLEDALLEIFTDRNDKVKDVKNYLEGEYYENFNKFKESINIPYKSDEVIENSCNFAVH